MSMNQVKRFFSKLIVFFISIKKLFQVILQLLKFKSKSNQCPKMLRFVRICWENFLARVGTETHCWNSTRKISENKKHGCKKDKFSNSSIQGYKGCDLRRHFGTYVVRTDQKRKWKGKWYFNPRRSNFKFSLHK